MSDPIETAALRTLAELRSLAQTALRTLAPHEQPVAILAGIAAQIDAAADELEIALAVVATARQRGAPSDRRN